MAYAVAQTAIANHHGWLDIPVQMYLDPTDYGYELHYIDVPVFDGAVFKGETDKLGNPVYQEEYDLWVSKLPKVKQLNPFHTHFIHPDIENITADKIKAQMDFHLPNFYEAWKAGKTIRSGWDTNTRIAPTRYDREMTAEQFAARQRLVAQKVSEFVVVSKTVDITGGKTFPATTIDVGPGAADYASVSARGFGATNIDLGNPANGTGTLDTFETWYQTDGTGVKMGTFSGSGTSYTNRDFFTWGNVASGSKQTTTGQSVDVSSGDFIGAYWTAGKLEKSNSGGTDTYYKDGDQFGAGTQTYTHLLLEARFSLYATGDTGGWANIAKINGIAAGDIAKINGIAVANIAKINGVAV